ncbi:MAG: hypothetical protein AB1711_10675 [Thermodesulfobacteriota bacterium]
MALAIKPTPKLNRKDSEKFLERVHKKETVASRPIPTPNLPDLIRKLTGNADSVSPKSSK